MKLDSKYFCDRTVIRAVSVSSSPLHCQNEVASGAEIPALDNTNGMGCGAPVGQCRDLGDRNPGSCYARDQFRLVPTIKKYKYTVVSVILLRVPARIVLVR